ncbi:signal transduction histidine kinase [Aquimarina brevivitae]|uniref:histidine kinase n=1 Tax=Aquimarina brevivitae TaxID=323412 RepID=A0A4Q7NU68_9FLAO|nr:signal transduction histidine kinase [Aquimarina brevivitae]
MLLFVCAEHNLRAQGELTSDDVQNSIADAEQLLKEYKYEQALEVLKYARQAAQYNNDDKNHSYISNLRGQIYEMNDEIEKAISNYSTAKILAITSKNRVLEIDALNNLGRAKLKKPNLINEAIEDFNQSYQFAAVLKDTTRMVKPLLNLGKHYIANKKYKLAYQKLSPAQKLISPKSDATDRVKLNLLLGKYYLNTDQLDLANQSLDSAVSVAKKEIRNHQNNKDLTFCFNLDLADAYRAKSNLSYARGNFKKAYKLLDQHTKYYNDAQRIKKDVDLQKASIKFDVDEYKKQAQKMEEDLDEKENEEIKWRISIILGIVIILISLAFLISSYKNNLQKKKLNQDLIEKNKELRTAKETAEQVSTLKSQFISTVSHELRTPLYGVIGLTSLLMENPDAKKKNEYLESLKFSGDYLLALINDVLQLSKIETNEVKLEKVSFDLKILIEGITNSLRTKQKSNNNKVHINLDESIDSTLIGDSVRLSQILINLMGNALKFTKDGNIWVNVKCLEDDKKSCKLRFVVKDDGIGIPKSKQKDIFDNFAQVKNQNQEYEGTGLGLAIVRKLIHLHESEIFIESEEGKGSEFYFDITYEKALKEKEVLLTTGENLSIGTTNFNLLVVDDNKINQIVTQNILKKKGYSCDIAGNGADAIEKIKVNDYDLVLMDINMPELNGLEATKIIRTFNSQLPIIALTAVEENEIRVQATAVGMNDVIIKPYDTQQFFQTIIRNISKIKTI